MLTTAENMINHALSTYTYDSENRIATRDVELPGRFCGCRMRPREAVIAAAWGWEQMVHLCSKSFVHTLYAERYNVRASA